MLKTAKEPGKYIGSNHVLEEKEERKFLIIIHSKNMQQLDSRATWLFFINFIAPLLIFLIFIGVFMFPIMRELGETETVISDIFKWLWVAVPLLVIFAFVWSKLTWHFYRYELRDDGFRKEKGVIWKKYVTIPYDRIQNVDIYRGLIARLLGLSDLHIQTAGSSSSSSSSFAVRGGLLLLFSGVNRDPEGALPGLSRKVAEDLRDELVRRAGQSRNQGL